MPKYVRFEEDKDVQWLIGLMQRAVQKMKTDPGSTINGDNVEIIPRVLDALLSAGDVEVAEAMGVSSDVVKADKTAEAEKVSQRKRKTRARKTSSKGVNSDPNLCRTHPKYGAVRRPQTDCKGCWGAYEKLHPLEYQRARRDFERQLSKKTTD